MRYNTRIMTTAIITDARFAEHTLPSHPERAERLAAVEQALAVSGLRDEVLHLVGTPANEAALAAVHAPQLLAAVRRLASYGGGAFDPDTYVTADSWDVATLAAGSAIRLVEAVVRSECANGFAFLRPPGHHATYQRAMGFCLINHIAVAARYAVEQLGLSRVAIVDYDVHHGNGTQDIFYRDGRVLFCSTHAANFYPLGVGLLHEIGDADGAGATLNVPLPFGVGDRGYTQIFEELIAPALRRFQPELILVSAGYDAHWRDPLGPMALSVGGYAHLTQMLKTLADELCGGRLALLLEGGYDLHALGACVVACTRVLMGREPGNDPIGQYSANEPDVSGTIAALRHGHPLLQGI
jgi:acetoin utilization deacetylase AcuC-like enzyme